MSLSLRNGDLIPQTRDVVGYIGLRMICNHFSGPFVCIPIRKNTEIVCLSKIKRNGL